MTKGLKELRERVLKNGKGEFDLTDDYIMSGNDSKYSLIWRGTRTFISRYNSLKSIKEDLKNRGL